MLQLSNSSFGENPFLSETVFEQADLFISTDEYQATENAGVVSPHGGPIVWQAQWRLAIDPGNHGHLPNLKVGKYFSGEKITCDTC